VELLITIQITVEVAIGRRSVGLTQTSNDKTDWVSDADSRDTPRERRIDSHVVALVGVEEKEGSFHDKCCERNSPVNNRKLEIW
jgi:hypothetical protein